MSKTLQALVNDATSSNTWWHQLAAYAALIVGLIDPGKALSQNVQLAIIGFGSLLTGLDLLGKHMTKRASVIASGAQTTSTTSVVISGPAKGA